MYNALTKKKPMSLASFPGSCAMLGNEAIVQVMNCIMYTEPKLHCHPGNRKYITPHFLTKLTEHSVKARK